MQPADQILADVFPLAAHARLPPLSARSYYDQAIYVFLPVALTTIGLLVAVYNERLGFIAFMVILSSLNALMIIYFRKRGKPKLMRL